MPDIKLGLIGCGRIAQSVHVNILTKLPGLQLVALAESDFDRRAEAHKLAPGAVAVAAYEDLLEMPDVDAVVICLPTGLHAEAAVAALERRKHVYLEKPIATGLSEARKVIGAWRRSGMVGMIGFNLRFHAFFQSARHHVQSGRLGQLAGVRSVLSTEVRNLPPWKQHRESGGGVLLDLASHHVDLLHFLFEQRVKEVFAQLRSQRSEHDTVMLQLQLTDGLLAQSFFSFSSVEEDRFEIYGRAGKLGINRYLSFDVEITDPTAEFGRLRWLGRKLRSVVQSPYFLEKILAPSREPSYEAAFRHFVSAIRNHQPATPDLVDGYRSLAVIEAAEASAKEGRIVSPQDFSDEDFARE